MVRCFEDSNVVHVDGNIGPARDIETINLELIFSDIEILDRRIAKVEKQARMDKTLAKELEMLKQIKEHLEAGKMARTFEVPEDEEDETGEGSESSNGEPVQEEITGENEEQSDAEEPAD